MEKESCTSATSTSSGLIRAMPYAALAAFFETSKLVSGPLLPARLIGLDASPSPATQTGLSDSFLAFSPFATIRQAAPSAFAQQSKSFRGYDTILDLRTSSRAMGFWNIALGFLAPYALFLTETRAMSSTVVPYLDMCAVAYIA